MHGIVRLLPVGQVALRVAAVGWGDRQVVVVIDVAHRAGHVRMPIGQQKAGAAVVKRSRGPAHCVVACGTVGSGKQLAG